MIEQLDTSFEITLSEDRQRKATQLHTTISFSHLIKATELDLRVGGQVLG